MKAGAFEYFAPRDMDEACRYLENNSGAKVLAGGQSLVPMMNFRIVQPTALMDINLMGDYGYIYVDDGHLVIGALARHQEVLTNPWVRAEWPLISQALKFVGHPAIRNRGTVCGSVAHADPAAEMPAVMTALNATMVTQSVHGSRSLGPNEFFLGYLTTALDANELIKEIRIPALPPMTGTQYMEISRRPGDFALVGVAAVISIRDLKVSDARIVLTGVGPTPFRAPEAESLIIGSPLDHCPQVFHEAASLIQSTLTPEDDIHASSSYRRHLAGVLIERALLDALTNVLQRA